MHGTAITLGNVKNSGADFDPGTTPTPGDSIGNDCAYALQAALNAAISPAWGGNPNRPWKVQLRGGIHNFWNPGTTPIPILIQSPNQKIHGAGLAASFQVLQTSPVATIPVGPSPFTYTNQSGSALYVKVAGGAVSLIQLNGKPIPSTSGSGANATSCYVCVQKGGSLTVTYNVAPRMTSNLSFLMSNVNPGNFVLEDFAVATTAGSVVWANFVDMTGDPNAGGVYQESGAKQGAIRNIRTGPAGGTDNFDILLDGIEIASVIHLIAGNSVSWCVPRGMLLGDTWSIGGGVVLAAQAAQLDGCFVVGPIVIQAMGQLGLVAKTPQIFNFDAHYAGPVNGPPVPMIVNNNAATAVGINIYGGTWIMPAGPAPSGWIANNLSTTFICLFGTPAFFKVTDNPTPLTASAPAGFNLQGQIAVAGSQTAHSLLANVSANGRVTSIPSPSSGSPYPATRPPYYQTAYVSGGTSVSAVGLLRNGVATTIFSQTPGALPGVIPVRLSPGDQVMVMFGGGTVSIVLEPD